MYIYHAPRPLAPGLKGIFLVFGARCLFSGGGGGGGGCQGEEEIFISTISYILYSAISDI